MHNMVWKKCYKSSSATWEYGILKHTDIIHFTTFYKRGNEMNKTELAK